MVQNDIHRSYVLSQSETGKIKDARWFHVSLLVLMQGYGRKIFFACSGNGNGTTWNNRGSNGNYWSSSFNSARNARNLNFNSGGVNPQNNNNRYNGFAVRAVQHTILTILSLLLYGTDTSAATIRPLSGILQCEKTQVETQLCKGMGKKSQAEHGRALRRSVLQTIQADAFEMFHRGLSEKEGNICCGIQRPYSTSSVFQLYSLPVREDVHSRHIQLYQRSWHSLWHRTYKGLLPQGEQELAKTMLCDALGYKRLFHAYSQETSAGNSYSFTKENGLAQVKQGLGKDMGRCLGHGLCNMAHRSHCHAESKEGLYYMWRLVRLGWIGPFKVDVALGGRTRTADRQSYVSAVLECLLERIRPVYEKSHEMQVLWPICGRCGSSQLRQGMASEYRSSYKGFHKGRTRLRLAHGQTGVLGSASWSGISRSIHQAIQDVHIESCFGENQEEDRKIRFQQALSGNKECQFVFGNIPTYFIVQPEQEAPYDKRYSENRHFQPGNDQI